MSTPNTPQSTVLAEPAGSVPLMGREYVNASNGRRAICVSHEMMGSVVMQNTTAPEAGKRWIAEVESIRRNWIEAERQLEFPNALKSEPRLTVPNYRTFDLLPPHQPIDPRELDAMQRRNNPKNLPVGPHTGRCRQCGSDDLWDDNLAYGCNSCGAILGSN